MKLYVEPMDAVVIEVADDGSVRFDDQELVVPTLRERHAILYAAQREMEALTELIDVLRKKNG